MDGLLRAPLKDPTRVRQALKSAELQTVRIYVPQRSKNYLRFSPHNEDLEESYRLYMGF